MGVSWLDRFHSFLVTITKRWWFTYARRKSLQSWASIYALRDAEVVSFFGANIASHREFLAHVLAAANGGKILEAGCGSSTLSVFLSTRAPSRVVALDVDGDVLRTARRNNALLGGRVAYAQADIRQLPFGDGEFGVAFSQGVLEHFGDQQIREILREQLRVAKRVLVSVPSHYYRARDLGDERLLTVSDWETLCQGFDSVRGKYYCSLRKAKNLYLRRPMMIMLQLGPRPGDQTLGSGSHERGQQSCSHGWARP